MKIFIVKYNTFIVRTHIKYHILIIYHKTSTQILLPRLGNKTASTPEVFLISLSHIISPHSPKVPSSKLLFFIVDTTEGDIPKYYGMVLLLSYYKKNNSVRILFLVHGLFCSTLCKIHAYFCK